MITVVQALINHLGIKLTALLTDWSGYIIFGTTAALIVLCLVVRADALTSAGCGPSPTIPVRPAATSGRRATRSLYLFALGLLLPIYTITGYDASAHTSEETYKAAHSVPRGIVHSVLWSSLVGWVMLWAIVIAIPDMAEGAKQGWNVFFYTMHLDHAGLAGEASIPRSS